MHHNKAVNQILQAAAEAVFLKKHTLEDWMRAFGRNYLEYEEMELCRDVKDAYEAAEIINRNRQLLKSVSTGKINVCEEYSPENDDKYGIFENLKPAGLNKNGKFHDNDTENKQGQTGDAANWQHEAGQMAAGFEIIEDPLGDLPF